MEKNNNIKLENIYAELWEIFQYVDLGIVSKIPKSILEIIKNNKNDNWNFKYDYKKNLNEQEIMEETKDFYSI